MPFFREKFHLEPGTFDFIKLRAMCEVSEMNEYFVLVEPCALL